MMDISLAGLVGAIVGTLVAAAIYGTLIDVLDRRLRTQRPQAPEDRTTVEQERALLRRGVLAFDIALCAGIGYFIGDRISSWAGG